MYIYKHHICNRKVNHVMDRKFRLENKPFVELKNLLKIMDYVNSGGEAKIKIQSGDIVVNDEVETRRGRKLIKGDIIHVDLDKIEIA